VTDMPTLLTDRVEIRPFVRGDRDVCRVLLGGEPEERDRWLEWTVRSPRELAALAQPPYGDRALVERATGRVVGAIGLVPSLLPLAPDGRGFTARSRPEVGLFWALLPEHRGRGYATEGARTVGAWALDKFGLERIIATTERDNSASIRVMERLGMRILHHGGPPEWLQVVGVWEHP
jgi:ribosomal-protein-alanine N-acetyltransferase